MLKYYFLVAIRNIPNKDNIHGSFGKTHITPFLLAEY